MKVIQVCHDYHTPFPHIARMYAACLVDIGCELETVFLRGEVNHSLAESLPGTVTFLDLPEGSLSGLKLKALQALRGRVQEVRPALILAHRFKPIYLSAIAAVLDGVPKVFGVAHEVGVFKRSGRKLFARLMKNRLNLVGISEFVATDIRQSLPGFPEAQVTVVPNCIDVEQAREQMLNRAQAREELGIPQDAKVLGTMGRLVRKKNQKLLLEAFAAWPEKENWLLVLMGDGRLREQLEQQAETLGVAQQTRFLGFVPDGYRYASLFDLFVLTTPAEGFGMVLLEAMVAGVTVLAPDSGAAPEVVPDKDYLFELEPDKVAEKIEFASTRLIPKESLNNFVLTHYSLQAVSQLINNQDWLGKNVE